jgi:hypothetical protein
MATTVLGGEISGWVRDKQGPLKGVLLCLTHESSGPDCLRVRATKKDGTYIFKPLKEVGSYTVKVVRSRTVKARRAEIYPNYVWYPPRAEVTVKRPSEIVANINFTGSFNFSNFHGSLTLTAEDFPELADFYVQNEYVFLKLYTVDGDTLEQDLIFLGQVTDPAKILIEASVPLSVVGLHYEVFSPTMSVKGTISITSTVASGS